MKVKVIGAGLAGVEAAWFLANKGISVDLYEMRPSKMTPAHKTGNFSELVCSNSLRAYSVENAAGLLKKEMEELGSIVMAKAKEFSVNAGGSLAVDREMFSFSITEAIKNHKNINVVNEEVLSIDDVPTIVATGPLTSEGFSEVIKEFLGTEYFFFFDAAAPVIEASTIDMNIAYLKSRYDKGEAAYLNCPMTKEEYDVFYNALINAECVRPHEFEIKVFEGCMPVEIMASRGYNTLLFGPLKPVGLEKDGNKPYAVVQLRQDNLKGNLYNIVGFQTSMKWNEQKKVIHLIPGLENAEIVRYGVMHRNSFINSPVVLNEFYQTKKKPNVFFAGQITGVEGYVESAASGILAAINMYKYINGDELVHPGSETMIGAMSYYVSHTNPYNFQPMNANFGIIKELDERVKKNDKKARYAERALKRLSEFKGAI